MIAIVVKSLNMGFRPAEDHSNFYSPKRCKNSARKPISKKRRKDVYKRDDYTCQNPNCIYRGKAFLTIDHRIPVSKGGTNDIDNLQAMCSKCNGAKGNRVV
jgi:5-methylcytosine-specific restriction protein A